MPEEVPSPSEEAGREAADGTTPPVDGSNAEKEKEESKKQWLIDMRGWIVVVAVQVASSTYQAGLNPPDHIDKCSSGDPELRCKVFFYSNTTAFLTSLAIIILLMNRSFYRSLAKVMVLEIIVVLDMVGLMAAYWAGSTCDDETMYALVLGALVLFVVYVVYTVQLVRKLWARFASVLRRVPAPALVSTAPVQDRQEDIDGARPPPSLVLDVGRLKSALRRRGSQLLARTPQTAQSTMRSRVSPAAYLSPSPVPKSTR